MRARRDTRETTMNLPTHTASLAMALIVTIASAIVLPASAGEEDEKAKAIDELLADAEHCISRRAG